MLRFEINVVADMVAKIILDRKVTREDTIKETADYLYMLYFGNIGYDRLAKRNFYFKVFESINIEKFGYK